MLADPEIGSHVLQSDDEFILLACDGLYDVMSNESACDFIRAQFSQGATCEDASKALVQHTLTNLHTRDNVTVIIVRIKQPQTVHVIKNTTIDSAEQLQLVEEMVEIQPQTHTQNTDSAADTSTKTETTKQATT